MKTDLLPHPSFGPQWSQRKLSTSNPFHHSRKRKDEILNSAVDERLGIPHSLWGIFEEGGESDSEMIRTALGIVARQKKARLKRANSDFERHRHSSSRAMPQATWEPIRGLVTWMGLQYYDRVFHCRTKNSACSGHALGSQRAIPMLGSSHVIVKNE